MSFERRQTRTMEYFCNRLYFGSIGMGKVDYCLPGEGRLFTYTQCFDHIHVRSGESFPTWEAAREAMIAEFAIIRDIHETNTGQIRWPLRDRLRYRLCITAAWLRISKKLVCEMSATRGDYDFHDYPDSVEARPIHFYRYRCVRCGKGFRI